MYQNLILEVWKRNNCKTEFQHKFMIKGVKNYELFITRNVKNEKLLKIEEKGYIMYPLKTLV